MDGHLSTYQLTDIWIISSFWPLWIMLLWTFTSKSLDVYFHFAWVYSYLEYFEEMQNHGYTILTTPPQSRRLPVSPHLANTCYCLLMTAILVGLWWYLFEVLTRISLMDGEHLFMSLLTICMFSLVKDIIKSFAYFLTTLPVLLLLSYEFFLLLSLTIPIWSEMISILFNYWDMHNGTASDLS